MSNFSGSAPRASSAVAQARAQYTTATKTFITSNFSTVSPGAPVCPCSFSTEPTHVAQAATLFAGPSMSTTDSETMGEMGAVHLLKENLAAQGKTFDPANLHEFAGANNFNLVYFDGPADTASSAMIVEAKGGSSTPGSRRSFDKKRRVTQGTADYVDTIIKVMRKAPGKSAKARQRQKVARNLNRIISGNPVHSKVLYIGVATKYNKNKKLVHDPVLIFATKV